MRNLFLLVALLGVSSAWASSDVICETYVVQNGDSLWSISSKFGAQQDDLLAALQQCVGYTGTLQVGQRICLPGWVPACDYVVDSDGVTNCKIYQIQAGDTLVSIASTFGIYTPDLQTLNADLVTGVLQVGKFIRLPPWSSTCPDPDSDAASCRVYTVQAGDFVFGIASVFRVSMNDLLSVNPGLDSTTFLQAGQRIRIPPFPDSCGSGIVAVPPTTGVFSCRAYRVKSGDSLASIALLFQTTIASLVSVNPELSDPSLLTPGKVVHISPYPAECINGILVDPTSNAPAVPAGPVASPSPSSTPSPSPATSVSPSPSRVTSTPSPSPSPSPSPVVSTPSPSPLPSPTPSPAASTPPPSTGIKVSFMVTGIAPATFTATKSAQVAASLASLLGVPSSWVSVTAGAPSRRRLQAAGESTVVNLTIAAADPTAAAARLRSAISSGALATLLSQLGLTLSANTLSVNTYGAAVSPSPSPAATPSPSPAPAATSTSDGSGGGSSNVGAIVGGVVGGVCGALLLAGLSYFLIKRRRAAAAAGNGGLRTTYAGATAQIAPGGSLSVKTNARKLGEDAGYSSSPRGLTPRTRAGQMA